MKTGRGVPGVAIRFHHAGHVMTRGRGRGRCPRQRQLERSFQYNRLVLTGGYYIPTDEFSPSFSSSSPSPLITRWLRPVIIALHPTVVDTD